MKIFEFEQPEEKIGAEETQVANHFFGGEHHWYNTRNMQLRKMISKLRKLGWVPIGEGEFGVVFRNENKNYVLKVSKNPDPAYASYVKMIKDNPNEYFPKISDIRSMMVEDKEYYMYLIERLQTLNRESAYVVGSLLKWLSQGQSPNEIKNYLIKDDWRAIFDSIISNEELLRAILLIGNMAKKHKFRLDIHHENVMQREDGTIVITDPYVVA